MSARTGQSPPAPPLHPPALPVQILRDRFGAWNRDRSATKRKEGKEAGDGGGEETGEEGRGGRERWWWWREASTTWREKERREKRETLSLAGCGQCQWPCFLRPTFSTDLSRKLIDRLNLFLLFPRVMENEWVSKSKRSRQFVF